MVYLYSKNNIKGYRHPIILWNHWWINTLQI